MYKPFSALVVVLLVLLLASAYLWDPDASGTAAAVESDGTRTPIRVGTLAFGTLNWELAVIRDGGMEPDPGFVVKTTTLPSAEAGKIGLQGNSVDLIVGDWFWVAHQRRQGLDFSFYPYSSNHGALMVPADSPIHGISDLKGKLLGIAGGGLDKNWLLLRALSRKGGGIDLDRAVEKTFGAPPLLDQQLRQGRLDAVLTYWNHAAKLEAEGYRKLVDGRGILQGLGVTTDVPVLGYIFRESWAQANHQALADFFAAADTAKKTICESDETWQKLAPLTREPDDKVRAALRRHYCEGRVTQFGEAERKAAAEIYRWLDSSPDSQFAESSLKLPEGVFWMPQ